MLNSINNINFKGVFSSRKTPFNNAQKTIFENIKTELGDEKKYTNFLVKPADNDSVQLSMIYGVKKLKIGADEKIVYTKKTYIGTYNKEKPFKLKDYYKVMYQEAKDIAGALAVGILGVGMLLGGIFVSINKKITTKPQIENVVNITKDSIQSITK